MHKIDTFATNLMQRQWYLSWNLSLASSLQLQFCRKGRGKEMAVRYQVTATLANEEVGVMWLPFGCKVGRFQLRNPL